MEWEPPSHLGYVILSGGASAELPRRHQARREDAADGPAVTTVIEWSATFDPKLPGTGALLRAGLRTMIVRLRQRVALRRRCSPRLP